MDQPSFLVALNKVTFQIRKVTACENGVVKIIRVACGTSSTFRINPGAIIADSEFAIFRTGDLTVKTSGLPIHFTF